MKPGFRRLMRLPLFTWRSAARQVDDELAFHIAERADRLVASGLTRDEALAEARRLFGDVPAIRDQCVALEYSATKRSGIGVYLDELRTDLRYGVRSLTRSPGFSLAALFTLVLGIASVTTVFSFVNAAWRPLPYPDANRIVAIRQQGGSGYFPGSRVWLPVFEYLRSTSHSFERWTAYQDRGVTAAIGGEAVQLPALRVDTSFRAMLGTPPALGRWLTADEVLGDAPVVVIADELWRRLGGDRAVLNRPLKLDGQLYTVVGVMPPGFEFPARTKVWRPFVSRPDAGELATQTSVSLLAKLAPGVDRNTARREIAQLASRLGDIDASYAKDFLTVQDEMVFRTLRGFIGTMVALFLGAAGFVLLIVCVNVATLMAARAAERRTEMAVRASLGASRGRLTRQMLAESLMLSTIAGILGALASIAVVRIALSLLPGPGLSSWMRFGIDARVLAFTLGVVLFVTTIVGILPARVATRFDLLTALKGATPGGGRARDLALGNRRGLIVQLALSLVLFLGTALMARSYQRAATFDFGFPAERVVTVMPRFDNRYPLRPARVRFTDEIASQLRRSAPATAIGVWAPNVVLMTGPTAAAFYQSAAARNEQWTLHAGDASFGRGSFTVNAIPDNYFDILSLRVVAGRAFSVEDRDGGPLVAVISAALAAAAFPDGKPIGRILYQRADGDRFTVVGVAEDVMSPSAPTGQMTPGLTIYVPVRQVDVYYPELLARSPGDVEATGAMLAAAVRAADPELATNRPRTLAAAMDEHLMVIAIFGSLFGFFALSALVLSMVGIYGVVAFGITQRTREIGIRMALGGTAATVVRLIVREGARFTVVGLVIGLAIGALVTQFMERMLFGTSPLDPLVYIGTTLVFAAVSTLACYIPARRASKVDPLVALRSQ